MNFQALWTTDHAGGGALDRTLLQLHLGRCNLGCRASGVQFLAGNLPSVRDPASKRRVRLSTLDAAHTFKVATDARSTRVTGNRAFTVGIDESFKRRRIHSAPVRPMSALLTETVVSFGNASRA